jgi:hypothetical protein
VEFSVFWIIQLPLKSVGQHPTVALLSSSGNKTQTLWSVTGGTTSIPVLREMK